MPVPQSGDVLILNVGTDQYELVEVLTRAKIGGPYVGFAPALFAARQLHRRAIWQQDIDANGQPINDLLRLPNY